MEFLVVEHSVVVGKEVEAQNPVGFAWRVHKLDNALAVFSSLIPHVSGDDILAAIDLKSDVWDSIMLFLGASTGRECVLHYVTRLVV